MENDDKIGVTVHTMGEAFDTGHIVSQAEFSVRKNHSLLQQYFSAYELSADVISDALKTLMELDGKFENMFTFCFLFTFFRIRDSNELLSGRSVR